MDREAIIAKLIENGELTGEDDPRAEQAVAQFSAVLEVWLDPRQVDTELT